MEAHITDLATWQWCQRKWWFTSRNALNLEPIRPEAALFLGSGVHHAMEQCYQPGEIDYSILGPSFSDWFDEGAKERGFVVGQDTDMDKLRELGLGMVRHYAKWAPKQDGFDVIATEQEFSVRMSGPVSPFAGRFDGVIRSHSTGRLWLHEFKTSSYNLVAQANSSRYKLDNQATAYLWAAEQTYNEPVEGILYTLLRKKVPSNPKLLKSGGLSVSKSIDTTAAHYLKCAVAAGVQLYREPKYAELIAHLERKEKENPFIHRFLVKRTAEEMVDIRRRIGTVVYQMGQVLGSSSPSDLYNPPPNILPNPTIHCEKTCAFVEPCLAMNRGESLVDSLEGEYRKRKIG